MEVNLTMIYGYSRVSTKGQAKDGNSLEAQEKALKDAGVEIIFSDAFTGTKTNRPELDKLINELKTGDKIIITKLDRIARSATKGFELIESLIEKGIHVHVLNMGLMDNTPTGKLIRHIMLAFAEFERDMIVERTQEGKSVAKATGKLKDGRPKKYSKAQLQHAIDLCNTMPISEVVKITGISKSTILRTRIYNPAE